MKSNHSSGARRQGHLNHYVKAVLKLVKGNALAQLITFSSTPIIARLYSKEQFGVLAVIVSASAMLSIIVSFKLELSIFNSRTESALHHAVYTAVITSLSNSIALTTLIFIFSDAISSWLNVSIDVLFFIPVFAFLLAIFNTVTNYLVYKGSYSAANNGKISKSVVTVISQFALAFWGKGLLLSEAVGRFAGSVFAMKGKWKAIAFHKGGFSYKQQLMDSNKFIKYSMPAGVMNSASLQIPSIFLAYHYGAAVAGVYFLVNRLAAAPLALMGQSMSQAFSSQFGQVLSSVNRKELVYKVVLKSLLVSLFIFSFVYIGAPLASELLFGDGWGEASGYLRALIPMFVSQLSFFAITNILNVMGKQHISFVWDMARLTSLLVLIVFAVNLSWLAVDFLLVYSCLMALFYIFLYCLVIWNINDEK